MRLPYGTVEQNIKKLNQKIHEYNQMVLMGNRIQCESIYREMQSIARDLKLSLHKKHVASTEYINIASEGDHYLVVYLQGPAKIR
jgi:hypothetical protein